MKSMGRAIQIGISVSLALAIATYSSFARAACSKGQTCPICPSGHKCITVTGTTEGTNCTLFDAGIAIESGASYGKCSYTTGDDTILLPLLSGQSSTTFDISAGLILPGATVIGMGVTKTILSFGTGTLVTTIAIDLDAGPTGGSSGLSQLTVQDVNPNPSEPSTGVAVTDSATATLTNVKVTGFNGSGIYNLGNLTVSQSTITQNSSPQYGGGVFNNNILVIHNSTIQNNNSNNEGGGIYDSGMMLIDTSTIANNNALLGGGGIYEEGFGLLAYDTIAFNSAEVGGGVEIADDLTSFDAFHVTVAMNSASLPFTALHCGVGGGVYAAYTPPNFLINANWNASIITGNTDGTPNQADDLVGDLHDSQSPSGEDSDGGNPSIVGNPQLGSSCQVGGWRITPSSSSTGNPVPYNDQQASPLQLFGTSSPKLASHPSNAPTQDLALVKPKSGTNPAINASTFSTFNLGLYETDLVGSGGTFPGGTFTTGRLVGQNKIDQGGQPAPSDGKQNLNYCIGSFEIQ